jgi:hypothetical protein
MPRKKQWIQSANVTLDQASGALVVLNVPSTAQESFDLLEFPIYHVEGIEDVAWDIRFALAALDDPSFAHPAVAGDTGVSVVNLLARVDYRGVPGQISPVTGDGIATKLSEVDGQLRSGILLVPLSEHALAALVPGKKYIRRTSQKARGHDEWSTNHDAIIVW